MTHQLPPELFVSERPIHSDYARERSYARRRFITVIVLVCALLGGAYLLFGHSPPNPADIPLIKAEGPYKQKPADPGGIDIPHQDVRVYDQLDGGKGGQPQVEHLLPPPETPKEQPSLPAAPTPQAATATPAPPETITPPSAKESTPILNQPAAKTVTTTVTGTSVSPSLPPPSAPVAAQPIEQPNAVVPPKPSAAPQKQPLSIEQVIANTKNSASTSSPSPSLSEGTTAIQLASVSDEDQAHRLMASMEQKYASYLSGVTLHLARADLGSRGITYRIQSQGLSESDASRICSSFKKINAGCILVRK